MKLERKEITLIPFIRAKIHVHTLKGSTDNKQDK